MIQQYIRGLKAGVPIGLGYLSVSFGLGILAVSLGFRVWQAVVISMLTLTSAGQLSGLYTMCIPGKKKKKIKAPQNPQSHTKKTAK